MTIQNGQAYETIIGIEKASLLDYKKLNVVQLTEKKMIREGIPEVKPHKKANIFRPSQYVISNQPNPHGDFHQNVLTRLFVYHN